MATLSEIRRSYPQYNDMSDQQLADSLHAKHYSDLPKEEFYSKVGLNKENSYEQPNDELASLKEKHPYLLKLADALKDVPGINKAGDIAGHFNRAVQGTGLPNFARGLFQSGSDLIRGPANLIPGVNIPNPGFSDMPIEEVNPAIQRTAEIGGQLVGLAPAAVAQEGIQGARALQKIPSFLRRIGTGSVIGGAISPEDRTAGAVIGGVASLLPGVASEIDNYKPLNPAEAIQKRYDKITNEASDIFDTVRKEAKESGINKIPVSQDLISEIKEAGPKSKSFRSYVDKASKGDYDQLRELQSELWKRAERYKSSPLGSEQDIGDELLKVRSKINDKIASHLRENGRSDLADSLKEAMDKWRKTQEVYHADNTISKLVGPKRLESKNLLSKLQEKSDPMKLLRLHNPEIEQSLKHKKYEKSLKKALGLLSGYSGLKTIGNIFSD